MTYARLTKDELIGLLNHAERQTLKAQITRLKREALLLGRDLKRAVIGTYRLGLLARRNINTLRQNLV